MNSSSPVSRRNSRSSVPMREWLVATFGGLTLAFSAWGLGGIPVWSLHVLCAGGLLTLIFALAPNLSKRSKSAQPSPSGAPSSLSSATDSAGALAGARRLLRWPFFWFSFVFLVYLVIGALNPAIEVVRDVRGWWVEAIEPALAVWLPTSVRSDYDPMNAWRVLVSFTAAFSLIWGLWAGLTRRKPVLLVLWCLLLSGAGMALVGMLQQSSGAEAVLWTFPSSNDYFWGSFFYRNQGVAYLNLILVAAAFLFFYHGVKTRQHVRSGGPHFLCFFLYVGTATSIGLALSRGGILFALILSFVFLALLLVYSIQSIAHLRSLRLSALTLILIAAGTYSISTYIDLDAIGERFGDIEATIENADQDARALSTQATWDMARVRLAQGWGAGSFRYIFPMYQRNYPEIHHSHYHRTKGWTGRRIYRYAHNDIVQFVAEYGLIGTGLVFGGIAMLLMQSVYHSRGQIFATLILLVGAGQAFGHAFVDFIFNSPAYWMAFLALLVASTKLLLLERIRSGGGG